MCNPNPNHIIIHVKDINPNPHTHEGCQSCRVGGLTGCNAQPEPDPYNYSSQRIQPKPPAHT
ncbi:hypothetical protein HanRHA438_Chr16g0739291 [Helianthus annuus]|nr:hypothetical protein HanRHA438_Chr16g0739291 [Helianthus annuus]